MLASWVLFPFFSALSDNDAATRLQAAWRRRKAQRSLRAARQAAVTLQRASRNAYWDAWAGWENPLSDPRAAGLAHLGHLSTMPGLVLERISDTKVGWKSTTAEVALELKVLKEVFKPARKWRRRELVACVLAAVLACVTIASRPSAVAANKQPASPPATPKMTYLMSLPGGGTVSLLGWAGNESKPVNDVDSWFSSRPTPPPSKQDGATVGPVDKDKLADSVLATLLEVPKIGLANATAAVVEAGTVLIKQLREILRSLLEQGVQLKQRVQGAGRFLLEGFR